MYLIDVFASGSGTLADLAKRLDDVVDTEGWDCLMAAAQTAADGVGWTIDTAINLSKSALRCARPLFEAVFGFSIGALGGLVLAIVGSGVPLSKADKPMYARANGPCLRRIPPKSPSGDPDEMCVR
jgi:hypothetical protein